LGNKKAYVISREEIEAILRRENSGVLGMAVDDRPYAIPITYGYADGRIIFHCALNGQKLDYIRRNPKVCFTVGRPYGDFVPHPQGAACHAHSDSVICYGNARIIEDISERCRALNIFNKCIAPSARDISEEEVKGCYAVEIAITEMTARKERDSQCTYLRYGFHER
jgi:uncharacterized protein